MRNKHASSRAQQGLLSLIAKRPTIQLLAMLSAPNTKERVQILISKTFANSYGLLVLYTYFLIILVNGGFRLRQSSRDKEKLLASRRSLWSLDLDPYEGVRHKFHTSDNGFKIHYVEAGDISPESELVILIHGFPDSYYSWRHQLTSLQLQSAHLIALDLPGYGGSDSFEEGYSPNNVLSAISVFIIDMKARKSHDRCILVTHDWGSLIGFRLASEAGVLFNRAIILSGVHPPALQANMNRHTSSFSKMIKTYFHNPREIGLLRHAFSCMKPLLFQMRYSHYIFCFRMPLPFARLLPTMGQYWWLRYISKIAKCSDPMTYLANSLGPGKPELQGSIHSHSHRNHDPPASSRSSTTEVEPSYSYPPSVLRRKGSELDPMISYYRDGLSFAPWDKPLPLAFYLEQEESEKEARHSYEGNGYHIPGEEPEGALRCPVIAVWGDKDSFYVPNLVMEGLEDYFVRNHCGGGISGCGGSATVNLEKTGHWIQVGSRGRAVVNGIVEWAIREASIQGLVQAQQQRKQGQTHGQGQGQLEPSSSASLHGDENIVPSVEELKEVVKNSYAGFAEVRCY